MPPCHDHAGRVDLQRVADSVLRPEANYYLCGPIPFMQVQLGALKRLGVDEGRIHYEVSGTDVFNE